MFKLYVTGDLGFEFWMDIPGYEGLYQASTYGRVRSYKRRRTKGKVLKQHHGTHGYFTVGLCGTKTTTVHTLIAKTFLPNPENKPCVEHKDTVRTNNRVENLRYVSYFENNHNQITVGKLKEYHKRISTPVCAYNVDGRLIGTFQSMNEASLFFGIQSSKVSRCVRGKQQHVHGIKFGYAPTPSV